MATRLCRALVTTGLAGIAGAGAVALGAGLEARSPIQRTIEIPGEGARLRILHISDVHMWTGSAWEVDWLASLADLDPDLVVLTGDNLCEPDGLPLLIEGLAPLAGIPGAFVFGSNDYFSGRFTLPLRYLGPALRRLTGRGGEGEDRVPTRRRRTAPDLPHRELAAFLTGNLGWADLRNAGIVLDVPLKRPGRVGEVGVAPVARVSMTGVDDPHINYDAPLEPGPGWAEANLRLALTHAPYARVLDACAALGADLVLAGHTHGGQVCLPVGRALVNNCDAPLAYSGGLSRWRVGTVADPVPHTDSGVPRPLPDHSAHAEAHTWLHVSRGLGTSKFVPLRLFCRPETALVTAPVAHTTTK